MGKRILAIAAVVWLVACSSALAAVPPAIQAAMDKVTQDVQLVTTAIGNVTTAQTAVTTAQASLKSAQGQLTAAQDAASGAQTLLTNDQAALNAAIAALNPTPQPQPKPGPDPQPTPPPAPVPPVSSTLRVLFLYDSGGLLAMAPKQAAILSDPAIRAYLTDKCPMESGCYGNRCPLNPAAAASTPSFRFYSSGEDVRQMTPVWQQAVAAAKAVNKPLPWLWAWNSAGTEVLSEAWTDPITVLADLQKVGGK